MTHPSYMHLEFKDGQVALISWLNAREGCNQPGNSKAFRPIMEHFERVDWESDRRMGLYFRLELSDFSKSTIKTIQ